MELHLSRTDLLPNCTLGELTCDGVFECFTLEDTVRNVKVHGMTAIPAGTYKVVITPSPRFKRRLPRLLDVPGFEGVLIHPGNTEADTEGCILVGEEIVGDDLRHSRAAFDRLFAAMELAVADGDEISITIGTAV